MAAVSKPEENGFGEMLMRTIHEEEIDLSEYCNFAEAYGQLGRFLDDVYKPEADPLVAGLPDPGGVRAAMAAGARSLRPAMNGERHRQAPVSVYSAVSDLLRMTHPSHTRGGDVD